MDWIIAGLGNPGDKYDETRHNAGFRVADVLAARWGVKLKKLKFQSLCADAGGKLLLKPQLFMNRSGQAVRQAADFYKLPPERVLIIYDDVSLPTGRLRVRADGSDGGHNGVRDILYHLQSDRFPRVKIGVGAKAHPEMDLADWVLSPFSPDERKRIADAVLRAADAAETVIALGPEEAMNRFNGEPKPESPPPPNTTIP
ncbi:MAG: aminoacyl-tRNA hydrolase [Oscillospiraceae bacterium]|nr:aminoacyl-tRNA hydrolase [Oscillospiraceae bacterium]